VEFQVADGAKFQEENSNGTEGSLKAFLHPPPPLERESFVCWINPTKNVVFVNLKMTL
jgi:hypothetical protein